MNNEIYCKIQDIDQRLNIIVKELKKLAEDCPEEKKRLNEAELKVSQAEVSLFFILAEHF